MCRDSPTHQWVYGLVDGWVYAWVDGWGQLKSLKKHLNVDLIKIIQFCSKIYVMIYRDTPTYGWVCGWLGG